MYNWTLFLFVQTITREYNIQVRDFDRKTVNSEKRLIKNDNLFQAGLFCKLNIFTRLSTGFFTQTCDSHLMGILNERGSGTY